MEKAKFFDKKETCSSKIKSIIDDDYKIMKVIWNHGFIVKKY